AAAGITPIARSPDHDDSTILRYLDRGVQGIIVPHVNTREQAERVTTAARYYPDGHRGAAGGRAHEYNVHLSAAETRRWINEHLLVIPMCEALEAVGTSTTYSPCPAWTPSTAPPATSVRAWAMHPSPRCAR